MAEEQHPQTASMAQVKQAIRRKLRRHPEHEHQELNIYAMIDMMTIILVFLIMQFASSAASKLSESPELQIPYSSSRNAVDNALTVTISRSKVLAPGRDDVQDVMVTLNAAGQVDGSDKQGGSNGFLITPLFKRMDQHRERLRKIELKNKSQPFTGNVQVVADKRTPFRTLAEVIYTLGQAEFKHIRFVLKEK
ncbi:MAG: biopolymer transporter ExbD [Myxococcales bacterium]|nr:biopolymer transporter ExbD [Myxococcales bacterium]